MRTQRLGRSELAISAVVMGTWQAGKRGWVGIDDAESAATLRAAFDAGITTFDTAEAYGAGHAERILGRVLGDVRDEIVIAGKVAPYSLRPGRIRRACERSLRNLGTDRIDLYQIHWPPGAFGTRAARLDDCMAELLALQAEGKVRALGVSNFSAAELEAALACGRIESLQPPYSLVWRHVETDALPVCRAHELSVLAYSPLAQGLLTGRFARGHRFAAGDNRRDNRLFQAPLFDVALDAVDRLRPIAAAHGLTLGTLALAWLLHQPRTHAVVGARTPAQIRENAAAAGVQLDADTRAAVDAIGRSVARHVGPDPVMWG